MEKYRAICREFASQEDLTVLQFRQHLLPILKNTLAPSTIRLYDQTLRKYAEIMGDIKLKRVNSFQAEQFRARRLESVSIAKSNIDHTVLRAAFNRAVTFQMISSNPFLACKKIRVPEKEPRFLSSEEFQRIIGVTDDEQMKWIILLALCTSMREGELLALHWVDVDLLNGLIRVRNTDSFTSKTRRRRTVPLNQTAIRVLLGMPRRSDYLFQSRNGRPFTVNNIGHRFKKLVRKAGLSEDIHFHSLRHTGASWLVQKHVPLVFVKEILGHFNIASTMVYSHATMDHLRQSVYTLDAIFAENTNVSVDRNHTQQINRFKLTQGGEQYGRTAETLEGGESPEGFANGYILSGAGFSNPKDEAGG